MGKFRIKTTEREDRAAGAPRVPGRFLGCLDDAAPNPPSGHLGTDTPGYGAEAKDISPLADEEAQA